jgi:hypothetical protein
LRVEVKKSQLGWLFATTLSMAGSNVAQTAAAPSTPAQFTLAISAVQSTVKAGEKIAIEIAHTNTSKRPIVLGPVDDDGYLPDVTVGGNAAIDTVRGRQWKNDGGVTEESSGPGFPPTKPGETAKRILVISDLYDLTHPGTYSVQVRRGTVKSNTITVVVLP